MKGKSIFKTQGLHANIIKCLASAGGDLVKNSLCVYLKTSGLN